MDDTTRDARRLEEVFEAWWREDASDPDSQGGSRSAQCAAAVRLAPHADASEPALGELLRRFESHARGVLAGAAADSTRCASRFADLRMGARWLRRAASGNASADPAIALLGEVEGLGKASLHPPFVAAAGTTGVIQSTVESVEMTTEDADLDREILELRDLVHLDRAERGLEAARTLCSGPQSWFTGARHLCRLADELEHTPLCAARQARRGSLVSELRVEADALEKRFFHQVEGLDSTAGPAAFQHAATILIGDLDGARVSASEPGKAADDSSAAQKLLHSSAAFTKVWKAPRGTDRAARRTRHSLARHQRRLRDTLSDRALQHRLRRLFGDRCVRVWDGLLFWLVLAAIALLCLEHYFVPPSEGRIGWIPWLDTGICSVLLADFLVRWLLSPERGRYFLRYCMTELLPCIPFSLIAHLEHVPGLQSFAALRLLRGARLLRVLQPLFRLLRLMLFFARAIDRFVESNAWILNRDLVMFDAAGSSTFRTSLAARAREIERWVVRATDDYSARSNEAARAAYRAQRLALLRVEFEQCRALPPRLPDASTGLRRELAIEEAVRTLRGLDQGEIGQWVGVELARQWCESLRLLRLPLLRRFQAVSYVMGRHDDPDPDPLLVTARFGHVLGDAIHWVHRVFLWLADLHGTVTAAQVIDRVGLQMVRLTMRPTFRLILFGSVFGGLLALIHLSHLEFLQTVSRVLWKFLSLPVLALGFLCIVPLAVGLWMRRVAGSTADLYERVYEAQFGALTETIKEADAGRQLEYLAGRVLAPEIALGQGTAPDAATLGAAWNRRRVDRAQETGLRDYDRLLLCHRDFLDGGYFHSDDTKVSSLLFGDLSLEELRSRRLRLGKSELKKSERFNLASPRAAWTGPYLWFRCITLSIMHHVARLILDYNQHCVPAAERERSAAEERAAFAAWYARRASILSARRRDKVSAQEHANEPPIRETTRLCTTEFTALHFLGADLERDRGVAERFGPQVAELMREDRRNLFRQVFSSYPAHTLDRRWRTLNGYELYRRYLARGRLFLLPVVALVWLMRGLFVSTRRLVQALVHLLQPHRRPAEISAGEIDFAIAQRKIHRMRRPIAIEALRLRARCDLAYLKVESLDGARLNESDCVDADLESLSGSGREWDEIRRLRDLRVEQQQQLREIVRLRFGGDEGLRNYLLTLYPGDPAPLNERLRAISMAFLCDDQDAWSLWKAALPLRALVSENSSPDGRPVLRRRAAALSDRLARVWPALRGPDLPTDARLLANLEAVWIDRVALRLDQRRRELLQHLQQLEAILVPPIRGGTGRPGASTPPSEMTSIEGRVWKALLDAAAHPWRWSEPLRTVRMVQSLAMLDLEGYENQVTILAGLERTRTAGAAS